MPARLASDVVLSACCAGLAVLLWWPTELWLLDVAASFRVQAGVAAGLLCVARLSLRRHAAAALWAVAAAFCLLDSFSARSVGLQPTAEPHLRVMLQNVHTENRAFNMTAATIHEVAPDVLAVLETDDLWTGALRQRLKTILPHASVKPRTDNFGIAMFSARPMDVTVFETPPLGLPSMEAVVQAGGGLVRIIATHPIPPLSEQRTAYRNAHIEAILARAGQGGLPTVVVGDLNLAPSSPAWRRLFDGAAVRRLQAGLLPAGTWPATLGVVGVQIDHVLLGEGLAATSARVLPSIGSDHRGIVVELSRLPRGGTLRR